MKKLRLYSTALQNSLNDCTLQMLKQTNPGPWTFSIMLDTSSQNRAVTTEALDKEAQTPWVSASGLERIHGQMPKRTSSHQIKKVRMAF